MGPDEFHDPYPARPVCAPPNCVGFPAATDWGLGTRGKTYSPCTSRRPFRHTQREIKMTSPSTAAGAHHKRAAAEPNTCADHHLKAAASHDANKPEEAKADSVNAMKCCESASKGTTTAWGDSKNQAARAVGRFQ